MRGAHRHRDIAERHVRIIPADAGSTARDQDLQIIDQDHPRRCGEHWTLGWPGELAAGSSPQMRGALAIQVCFRLF